MSLASVANTQKAETQVTNDTDALKVEICLLECICNILQIY